MAEVKEVIGKTSAGEVVRGQVMENFLCQAVEFGLCPEDSMGGVEEFQGEPGFGWFTLQRQGHNKAERSYFTAGVSLVLLKLQSIHHLFLIYSKQYSMAGNDMDSWSHPSRSTRALPLAIYLTSGILLKSWCLRVLCEDNIVYLLVISCND